MEPTCPVCRKTVKPGLHGFRLDCNCWVHTKCVDKKNPDFSKCLACKGQIDRNTALVNPNEPAALDGRDYIHNPMPRSYLTQLYQRGFTAKEPFTWLREKKRIDWMVHDRNYGLQMMIKSGVRLQDFLDNGYTWEDLKGFKDFSGSVNDKERARKALVALHCNAEHFRDYEVQMGSCIKDLEITGRHLVEMYGIFFPKNKNLSVVNGKNEKPWIAKELVKLGFKMIDLYGADIEYYEQYEGLQPTDEDEVAMGVTDEDVANLPLLQPRKRREEVPQEVVPVPTMEVIVRKYIDKNLPQIQVTPVAHSKAHGLRK
jgi:hypothetical protein